MDSNTLTASIIPPSQCGPLTTSLLVGLFGWALPGGLLAYFWHRRTRQLRLAREADDAQWKANRPLAAGAAVLAGTVLDEGEGAAVTVRIHQRGEEKRHKGAWQHSWTETHREVTARPFHVLRASGERVRVEPDERVSLVDKLDGITQDPESKTRCRTATLTRDERVYVVGTLVHAQDPPRGAGGDPGTTLVMRPPRGEAMLISTEPLADRHARAGQSYLFLALVTLVVLAITHGAYLSDYYALQLRGHRVEARITGTRTFDVWEKPKGSPGHNVSHYVIQARDPQTGAELEAESSQSFYLAAQSQKVTTVPFMVAGSIHQLGAAPTESEASLLFLGVLSIGYAIFCAVALAHQRPWWARKRVIDTGSGRLAPDTVSVR